MINACQKGKRVERELAAWLREQGLESARRTEQYCGKEGTSDVVCEELPLWHIESKGVQSKKHSRIQIKKWWEQVIRDKDEDKLGVVVVKADNTDRIAIIDSRTFFTLVAGHDTDYSIIPGVDDVFIPSELLRVDHITQLIKQAIQPEYKVTNTAIWFPLCLETLNPMLVILDAYVWLTLARMHELRNH